MIPATRNFGFDSAAHVLRVIPWALLAALVLTALYVLWLEYGEEWIKTKWH